MTRLPFQTWCPWGFTIAYDTMQTCQKGSIAADSAHLRSCTGMVLFQICHVPVCTRDDVQAVTKAYTEIDMHFRHPDANVHQQEQSVCAESCPSISGDRSSSSEVRFPLTGPESCQQSESRPVSMELSESVRLFPWSTPPRSLRGKFRHMPATSGCPAGGVAGRDEGAGHPVVESLATLAAAVRTRASQAAPSECSPKRECLPRIIISELTARS